MRRLTLALLPLLAFTATAIRIQITNPAPQAAPARITTPATPYRPSDPQYAQQWNLKAINVEGAWMISRGAPITIAVLDTGFADVPDLRGRVINGYDFVSDHAKSGDGDGRDADALDHGRTAYHGTMVASLIAAAHDGSGMAGINPRARIVQVRVAEDDGLVRVEDLVDAMRWSAGLNVPGTPRNANPARLLNLSLFADYIPLDRCDERIQTVLDELAARGVIVVAGAGNDNVDAAGYTPAGCRNVITVTATTRTGARAGYANWGESITLAAPGGSTREGNILVATPGGFEQRNGTSFAAPHVTGVVSLMLNANPRLSPADVTRILRETANPFPAGACDPAAPTKTCGAGVLDASKAFRAARTSALGR